MIRERNDGTALSTASPESHTLRELREAHLNQVAKNFGLIGWVILWQPDKSQPRGKILPEERFILIHDEKPEAAQETLIHEILELKLRPMLKPYRSLTNLLIEWADKQVYESKERVLEDLLPFLLKFIEEMYPNQRKPGEVPDG